MAVPGVFQKARSSQVKRNLIYGICEPDNGFIRYVGQSSRGMIRPSEHWGKKALTKTDRFHVWIKSVVDRGMIPAVDILQELDPTNDVAKELNEAEKFWYDFYKFNGCDLLNSRRPISYPTSTPERNAKISKTLTGRKLPPFSDLHRARISAAKRGKPMLEKHREAMIGRLKGRKYGPLSEERREKIKKAAKAYWDNHAGEKRPRKDVVALRTISPSTALSLAGRARPT